MTKQRIVLWSFIALLFALPFAIRYYRGSPQGLPMREYPDYIPITEILPVHEQRIKDRIELLKKQSLDETFAELSESQQYHYPGYHPSSDVAPRDIEKILSTRSFLKVFQQFGALPKEQATEKLNVFCEEAIRKFNEALEISLWRNANPALEHPAPISIVAAKYMVCSSLLLAARAGEYQLLINQIDEMQPLIDSYVEKKKAYRPPEPSWEQVSRKIASLEDDAVLTVLMYALQRAGKDTNIPFEGNVKQKTIPLFRWDAALTHYDFEAIRQLKKLDPKDAVEHFVVYEFANYDRFDNQKKKLIIDTLKERLSK